jgi:hypothetical protein
MNTFLKRAFYLACMVTVFVVTGCSNAVDDAVAINEFGTTDYGQPHLENEALVVPISHVSAKYNGSNFEIELDRDQKIWTLRLVKNKKKQHEITWYYEEAYAIYSEGNQEFPIGVPERFNSAVDFEASQANFKLKEKDIRNLIEMYEDVVAANAGLFDGPTIRAAKGENPLGLSRADLVGKFAPPISGGTSFGWYKSWACYAANEDLQVACSNQYCIGCAVDLGCTCICFAGDLGCACEALGVACDGPVEKRGETYDGPRFDVPENQSSHPQPLFDKSILKS